MTELLGVPIHELYSPDYTERHHALLKYLNACDSSLSKTCQGCSAHNAATPCPDCPIEGRISDVKTERDREDKRWKEYSE